jgi:AraC-like DNA-binding protein
MLPAGLHHRIARRSAVANLATLVVHGDIRRATVAEYGVELDFARLERLFDEVVLLPRTVWVNELCHRYVFERVHCGKHDSLAARFVEVELVKELLFLLGERRTRVERATLAIVPVESAVVARALAHLEERLFEPLDMARTARAAGASPSTLLRAFKRELGGPPSAWLRGRRLDEAMLLLKTQRLTVSEVAERVGYGSVASFTHAFSRHFGELPSAVRDQRGS